MPDIVALTLTDAERAAVPALWPEANDADPVGTAFLKWQRDTLAAEIERRAAEIGRQASNVVAQEAVQQARDDFPSVFGAP